MRFVANHLIQGEKIIFQTRVHWMTVIPWFVLTLLSGGLAWVFQDSKMISVLFTVATFGFFLKGTAAGVFFLNTIYAITTHRVLGKTGLIRINSLDVLLLKVEAVKLEKGIIGRIFEYGDLIVSGTGGTKNTLFSLPKPQKVRKLIQQLANKAHSKTDGIKVDFEHEKPVLKQVA